MSLVALHAFPGSTPCTDRHVPTSRLPNVSPLAHGSNASAPRLSTWKAGNAGPYSSPRGSGSGVARNMVLDPSVVPLHA